MKTKMNVMQALHLAQQCDRLFKRAANAWERGNSSGNSETMKKCYALWDRYQTQAEELLKPLSIEVDYPGLYPSFKVNGFDHHSTLSAVSAALEDK